MAARKQALLAFVACATRALSARSSPPNAAAMAVVPRAPESGGAVVAEAVRGMGPTQIGAFAGVAAIAGVGICILSVPTSRQMLVEDSDGNSREGSFDRSANGMSQNISSFMISTFFKDLHVDFRGPSGRDFKNLANALRQHASELRKTRKAESARRKGAQALEEKKPEKHWFSQLHETIELINTYFYLPEAIGDICAYLFAAFGGSVIFIENYLDTTRSYFLDPGMCSECPFSGCMSLLPMYDEMSSSDPSDSNDTGEACRQVTVPVVPVTDCDAGNSNGTTKVGLQCVLAEGSQLGDKCSVKRSVIGRHCRIGSNVKIVLMLKTLPLEEFLSYDPHMFLTGAGINSCGRLMNSVPVPASLIQKQLKWPCFTRNMYPFGSGWITLLEQVPFGTPQS